MSKESRFALLSSVLLFVLLVGLACPVTAFADDGTPPPAATEEPAQPPEEETATPPPLTEEASQPTTAPVVVEAPVEEVESVSPLAEEPAVNEITAAQVLEAAPEDTQVVVLNGEGSPEPLASVEAAEIFQTGDPHYTVSGITYYFMPSGGCGALANCTESAMPIQTAIDYLNGTAALSPWLGTGATPQDGTIYVEAGVYTGDVTLNGNAGWNAGANKPAALTLSGAGSDSTVLDGSFFITNMNVFTLSGFTVIDADYSGNPSRIVASDNNGDISLSDLNVTNRALINDYLITGITIERHRGDIALTHVTANNNSGAGVGVDNCIWMGQFCTGSGSVHVSDSILSDNGYYGLSGESGGEVTFTGVTATGNGYAGLSISTWNDITLTGVTANRNDIDGAFLSNCWPGGYGCWGNGIVNIMDSNFNENGGFGVHMLSTENITLSNVTANGNGGYGAYLDNKCRGGKSIPGGCSSDILVSNSSFNGNGIPSEGLMSGLRLDSGGNATVLCDQFNNNSGFGIDASILDGSLTLDNVIFTENVNGDYTYSGTPIIASSCVMIIPPTPNPPADTTSTDYEGGIDHSLPLHIVPVDGGEQTYLDCHAYSGTKLILSNGDQVTLPCPIHDHGVVTSKTADQLPAPLNVPLSFASALDVQVIRNGEAVSRVNVAMTVDFVIPDSLQSKDFAILRWDAEKSQWVEVAGGTKTGDGRFMATSAFTGIYVLVTK